MNSTRNLILAAAFAVNAVAIAAITVAAVHQHAVREANAIKLGTIVVTPADAVPAAIDLGVIVVTPNDADWAYAKAHGMQPPVTSTPSLAGINANEDASVASLIQALDALSPGQFLNADATVRVLNTLVFDGQGR